MSNQASVEASVVVHLKLVGDLRPSKYGWYGTSNPHQGVELECGNHTFQVQLGEEEMRKIADRVGRVGRLILRFD